MTATETAHPRLETTTVPKTTETDLDQLKFTSRKFSSGKQKPEGETDGFVDGDVEGFREGAGILSQTISKNSILKIILCRSEVKTRTQWEQ